MLCTKYLPVQSFHEILNNKKKNRTGGLIDILTDGRVKSIVHCNYFIYIYSLQLLIVTWES